MGTIGLDGVDGYAYADIDGAARLAGPLRCARKVLPRTTIDLARHATYALAIHGVSEAAGGAAALNLDRDAVESPDEALVGFTDAVRAWAGASGFAGTALMGLSGGEAPEGIAPSDRVEHAAIASAVASASVSGASVAVVTEAPEPLAAAAESAGARSVDVLELADALSSGVDVLILDGPTGALHHGNLAEVNVGRVASVRPLATTARGLAFATRGGTVIVPDFVSAGGPALIALEPDADVAARTADVVESLADSGPDMFVAACEAAEAFLRTWTDDLPFGRPLAP